MELWDLYTEDRVKTGQTHIRGDEMPEDRYHLVVHVWIVNSKGEYLISQRSANRPTFPLMWECVGGSVTAGEDSLQGAIRETKEEVGVSLLPENGKLLYSEIRKIKNGIRFNDMKDVWLFRYDGKIPLHRATTDEVVAAEWMTVDQIRALYRSGVFVESLAYFFDDVVGR